MPVSSRASSPYLHRCAPLTVSRCTPTSSTSSSSRATHLRSVSLDRSASSSLASARISRHLPSSASSSYSSTATSPPKRSENLELRERLARLEIASSTSLTFTSASRTTSTRASGSRKAIDALYDQHSPVLTKFRRLGEPAGLTRLPPTSTRRVSVVSSESLGTLGVVGRRRDSDLPSRLSSLSSSSFSSTSSRSSTLALDENPLRTRSRSRSHLDINRNLLQSGGGDDGNGEDYDNDNDNARGSRSPVSSTGSTSSRYSSSTSGYGSDTSIGSSPGTPHNTSRCFQGINAEKGGVVGLRNLGNTCFMNSVLQCLSHSRPLLEYCLKESYQPDINTTSSAMKGALIKAFVALLQSMWQADPDTNAISLQAFKNQVQKFAPRFMGYSQQDAQEFLRYLLQGLHEDVNRVTCKPVSLSSDIDDNFSDSQKANESWRRYIRHDDSRIVDLFVGQLKSTLQCTFCGYSSVTFDPFWDLSLPIPKSSESRVQLRQCLDLFTKEEILDGDEKPTCSKCKTRRKCTKSFSLQKFPKILVIPYLKRFSPSERYKTKLSTNVDFPLYNLDLSSYATSHSRGGQSCVYNLYGVSNHSGSVYTGHYTATCKHPYTGDWHEFNDSRASKSTSNNVASPEGYVLFYEQAAQSSRL